MEIRSIMCCCGQGLGSSMIVSMNVERALKSVSHTSLSEANENGADLFVVGRDLAPQIAEWKCKKIFLEQLLDMNELETKLKEAFGL